MAGKRKVHTAAFKAQVALAALKGDRTGLLPLDWSIWYESHSRPRGQEDSR